MQINWHRSLVEQWNTRQSSIQYTAQLVCDSTDSFTDESKYLDNVFSKNNYNPDFVKRKVYETNEPNTTNANNTMPYIKGTSETIARILQPYNIRVAHRPITTLRQLLTNVNDKDEPNIRQGAVYKIKCCDCKASYIGETGRNLNIRPDWTQTGDEKWWCQQSHCWTPFTHESQNWLGLCWMRYLQYGLLQTTHSRKLER